MARLFFLVILWLCACRPASAQRRVDAPTLVYQRPVPAWVPQDVLAREAIRRQDPRLRLRPAVGMVIGGVTGAAIGVGLSRATCDPSHCDGMAHVSAFFLGGIAGSALGYIIAGGKRLPGTHRRAPTPASAP